MNSEGEAPVELTVVIATASRAAKLERTLGALANVSSGSPSFQVVAVVDGPDPETLEVLANRWPFPLHLEVQPRRGAAAARNRGCRAASGAYVLFLNDDTPPHPKCLRVHWEAQRRYGPCLVLGQTAWDPETPSTPYMRWLAPAGHQFNFLRLKPYAEAPWDACWATNLSLPRQWAVEEPFDEAYPGAGGEDSEWGYRLWRRGRKLVYVPEAVCTHDHRYEGPADFRGRARGAGAGAVRTVRRHPELFTKLVVRPTAALAARVLSLAIPGRGYRAKLWDLDYRWHYLRGVVGQFLRREDP